MYLGASGTLNILAEPRPIELELPISLVATTLTEIMEPHIRLYGAFLKVSIGIVHSLLDTIATLEPSQFVVSSEKVTPSFWIIEILYEVMGNPPSFWTSHEIFTDSVTLELLSTPVVDTGEGSFGAEALIIMIS